MFDRFTPKFVKKYTDVGEQMLGAFEAYVADVVSGDFPTDQHSFHIKAEDLEEVIGQL